MKRKPSKTEVLGTAVCFTILAPIWIFIAALRLSNPDLRNSALILIIIVAAVCTVACAVHWYRYATYDKKLKNEELNP